MTIQEAINRAKEVVEEKYKEGFLCYANSGDIENDKKNDECVKCAKEHEQLARWLEELQQYRAIGTVEECREARERQRAKKYKIIEPCKSVTYYQCPYCNGLLHINENFCSECGQAILWEEE